MAKAKRPLQKKSKTAQLSYPELLNLANSGNMFLVQGKFDEAIASYQKVLACNPDFAEVHNNLGVALQQQGKLDLAIEHHRRALKLKPNYVDACNNLGLAFKAQGNFSAAIKSYQAVISMKPDYANAYYNLAGIFRLQGKLAAATENYQRALSLAPGDIEIRDMLFFTKLHCCDWTNFFTCSKEIISEVASGKQGHNPFSFLAISSSLAAQKKCAENFAKKQSALESPKWTGSIYQHHKIRIAYLSADFHNHATAYLMAELFEIHDKNRFEVTAISFGPNDKSAMRDRLITAFDRFIDAQKMDTHQIASLVRELEIDIAIDLKGYTTDSRAGILATRPAPIQINYLGYPGTMGADYIDYILADKQVIPPEHLPYYTEKVVYLPDSYQVNDSKRQIAEVKPTKTEVNLPEQGFVFCCFNSNYKFTPEVFGIWMRLLNQVKGSVLWLLESNPIAVINLRKEAVARGISPERLIFAPFASLENHLARLQLADLFLDTLPVNAHTTASDALWAGVPILTCMGESFVGRVAGSLLHAVGLPELITHTVKDYEALALKLATDPELLASLRVKLEKNKAISPLFDTKRFCHHLETAYIMMWERHQHGEEPVSFSVPTVQ